MRGSVLVKTESLQSNLGNASVVFLPRVLVNSLTCTSVHLRHWAMHYSGRIWGACMHDSDRSYAFVRSFCILHVDGQWCSPQTQQPNVRQTSHFPPGTCICFQPSCDWSISSGFRLKVDYRRACFTLPFDPRNKSFKSIRSSHQAKTSLASTTSATTD